MPWAADGVPPRRVRTSWSSGSEESRRVTQPEDRDTAVARDETDGASRGGSGMAKAACGAEREVRVQSDLDHGGCDDLEAVATRGVGR